MKLATYLKGASKEDKEVFKMKEVKCILCGEGDRGYRMILTNLGYICGWCYDICRELKDEIF